MTKKKKKGGRRRTTRKYIALYARYAIFPREVAALAREETKCRPTSAAATRNFVTPLPSCNDDALSWISTRFPPVSDRLSIRGASKLPPPLRRPDPTPPPPPPPLAFSPAGAEKKN